MIGKAFLFLGTHVYRSTVEIQGKSVTALCNLRYHYYAGYCFCVQKKFQKAIDFFTIVLTASTDRRTGIKLFIGGGVFSAFDIF